MQHPHQRTLTDMPLNKSLNCRWVSLVIHFNPRFVRIPTPPVKIEREKPETV